MAEVVLIVAIMAVPAGAFHLVDSGQGSASNDGAARISAFGNTSSDATTTNATAYGGTASTLAMLSPSLPSAPPVPAINFAGNWRTFEYNQQRSGNNLFENTISTANASQLTRAWVAQTTAGILGSPAVVNGTVYVGDYSGNESAFNASTGQRIWYAHMAGSSGNYSWTGCFGSGPDAWLSSDRQNNVRGITASATVWRNTVFVPADNNHLYALNASTGNVTAGWPVDMSNHTSDPQYRAFYPYGSPLVYEGYVYIGTASGCDAPLIQGQLLQINIATPGVAHLVNMALGAATGGGIWSTPSLEASTGTVWVTTGNCPTSGGCNSTQNWTQAIVALSAANVCQPQSGVCSSRGYYHLPSGNDVDFGAGATVYTLPWNHTSMVVATDKNGWAYAFYADTLKASGASNPAWKLQTSSSGCVCGKNIAVVCQDMLPVKLSGDFAALRVP